MFRSTRTAIDVLRGDCFSVRAILERVTDPGATEDTRIRSLAVRGAPREDPPDSDPVVRGRPCPREWIAGEAVDEGSRRRSGGGIHRRSRAHRRGRAADRVACRGPRRRDLLRRPQPARGAADRARRSCPCVGKAGPASDSGASWSACAGAPLPELRAARIPSGIERRASPSRWHYGRTGRHGSPLPPARRIVTRSPSSSRRPSDETEPPG